MRHCRVRDVMTVNPMTVTPATSLKNVAEVLVKGQIAVVPVLTPQGRVACVVAEGDLKLALMRQWLACEFGASP